MIVRIMDNLRTQHESNFNEEENENVKEENKNDEVSDKEKSFA